MISLQKNLVNLHECFGDFHTAVSANQRPGQKLLNNCIAQCHATNEVVGVEYFSPKKGNIHLLSPIFIDGSGDYSELLHMAVGNEYAELLQAGRDEKQGQFEFASRKCWNIEHLSMLNEIEGLNDPKEMFELSVTVALSVLKNYGNPIGMVCGPISTGSDTIQNNLYRLNRTIMEVAKGMPVFNQLPFEGIFTKIHELLSNRHVHLLNLPDDASLEERRKIKSIFFIQHFYERVIKEAHKRWIGHFMKEWETSVGATMEHELLKMLGHEVVQMDATVDFLN